MYLEVVMSLQVGVSTGMETKIIRFFCPWAFYVFLVWLVKVTQWIVDDNPGLACIRSCINKLKQRIWNES